MSLAPENQAHRTVPVDADEARALRLKVVRQEDGRLTSVIEDPADEIGSDLVAGLTELLDGPDHGGDLKSQAGGASLRGRPQAAGSYGSRPTRRVRRSKADIARVEAGLYEILEHQHPATVRGTFYQAVSRGLVGKSEAEYKGTVVRLLTKMRRAGELPYGWLSDNTRWMRKPRTYSNLEDMLALTAQTYRRALWDSQSAYVEVWRWRPVAGVKGD